MTVSSGANIAATIQRQGAAAAQEPLPISTELVRRLSEANVRYGVYKNRRSVREGLAGSTDLNLLVDPADIDQFRRILKALKSVRGLPHRLNDNVVEGREDWFVPDFERGDYLHLDVTTGIRVGHKFRKRYLAFSCADVAAWQTLEPSLPPIPVVSGEEEARIALLRSVFRLPLRPCGAWVRLDTGCSQLLQDAVPSLQHGREIQYRLGTREVTCAVRYKDGVVELESSTIRRLRHALRLVGGDTPLAEAVDFVIHQTRRLIYFGLCKVTGSSPARNVGKKSIVPSGILVALVGPDGVGKSTQVARLATVFQKKFRCTTVYLGSGEGGWKLRRLVRRRYDERRARRRVAAASAKVERKPAELGSVRLIGVALWALGLAIERYVTLLKARREAVAGAIVISDRWPQNLQPGVLDGPRRPPTRGLRSALLFSRIERSLYRRMEKYKPELTIHLVADFKASHARKPGDIDRPDFERRLSFMGEMRRLDPAIKVVDARHDIEKVTRTLFCCLWLALWLRTAPELDDVVDPAGTKAPARA